MLDLRIEQGKVAAALRIWLPSTPGSSADWFSHNWPRYMIWMSYICEDISLNPVAELVLGGSRSGSGSRLNEQDKNMAACSISGHYFRPRLCFSRPSTHFFIPRLLFCLFRLSRCFPAQLCVLGFANRRPLELMGVFFPVFLC